MTENTKTCAHCKETKDKADFVSIYGFPTRRGKYCSACFKVRQQSEVVDLMEGRDFCLYCGLKITKARDYSEKGNSVKTYVHQDHMDPVALGGFDPYTYDLEVGDFPGGDRNVVYCCAGCNIKKKDTPFVEWLETLRPEFQKLSRDVYVQKNGRQPEDFVSTEDIVIKINVASELNKKAPANNVDRGSCCEDRNN